MTEQRSYQKSKKKNVRLVCHPQARSLLESPNNLHGLITWQVGYRCGVAPATMRFQKRAKPQITKSEFSRRYIPLPHAPSSPSIFSTSDMHSVIMGLYHRRADNQWTLLRRSSSGPLACIIYGSRLINEPGHNYDPLTVIWVPIVSLLQPFCS